MKAFVAAVEQELKAAKEKHQWPQPPSYHHAHSVLLEEVEEFWVEVKKQNPDKMKCLKELVQIGAMAQRAAEELGLIVCMTNLFAYRATQPKDMKAVPDPIGLGNTKWLVTVGKEAGLIICAWGRDGQFLKRQREVLGVLRDEGIKLHHLGLNDDGTPKHPLYLRADTQPILWEGFK